MKRSAFTIIELLVSLALLAGLSTVLVSWMMTVARFDATHRPRQQWEQSADEVLSAINHDLLVGDFGMVDRRGRSVPRATLSNEQVLRIQTRQSALHGSKLIGAVFHEYRLDNSRQLLFIQSSSVEDPNQVETRPLLSDVEALKLELNKEKEVLTVRIRSVLDQEVTRRFKWPKH